MFSRSKSETAKSADGKSTKSAIPSIISEDLTIKGDLISDGEIQIDGRVEGDINMATLLVSETAEINGEIKAERVRVYGRVNGQITAQSVTLASTAHVFGDISYEDLTIERGAFLKGHCQRIADKRVESIVRGKDTATSDATALSNVREVTPPVPTKPQLSAQKEGAPGLKKMAKSSNGGDKATSA